MIQLKNCLIWTYSYPYYEYDDNFMCGLYINDRVNYFILCKDDYEAIHTLKFYKL